METDPIVGRLSDDRQWWWDGVRWLPTLSPDRKWWFDGRHWRRNTAWRRPPRAVLVYTALWALVLILWAPLTLMVARTSASTVPTDLTSWFGVVAIGVVLLTPLVGLMVCLTSQLRWTWAAALLGTGMQMAGYVALMLSSPQPGGVEDDAAAIGLVILTLPILLAVTALLWLGAGTGLLVRWARKGRDNARVPRR